MKKINLLLTLPVAATTLIPMASCSKAQGVKLTLTSEKQKQISLSVFYFMFNFAEQVDKTHINFRIFNETKPTGGVTAPVLTLDGRDMYLTFAFENYEYGTYSFDIEFEVDGFKTTFTGLSVTLVPATNVIPTAALVINDGVLEGLSPDFQMLSIYDTLQIPTNVTSIKENAFKDSFSSTVNPNVTTIIFNNNLTTIGSNAFNGCNAITTLDVSNVTIAEESPITIGSNAFANWNITGEIKYKTGTYYNALDYELCDAGLEATWFKSAERTPLKSDFHMPMSTIIDGFAWNQNGTAPRHMTELVNILSFPESVTQISNNAFYDATSSKSLIPENIGILWLSSSIKNIGDNVFRDSEISIFKSDLGYYNFPYKLESIGAYAFSGTKIYRVKFQSNFKTLSDYAFYNCQNLEYIDTTELKVVPTGWSKTGTFDKLCATGIYEIIPSTETLWDTYYSNFDFGVNKWTFTNTIDLLETTYTPGILPIAAWEPAKSQADAVTELINAYSTQTTVLIDDIAYTFYDGDRSGLHQLDISFTDFKLSSTGLLSGTINFAAETMDPVVKWTGSWTFYNISLTTHKDVIADTTQKIMTFRFQSLFDYSPSFIYIDETKQVGETKTRHTATINSLDTITEDNMGPILTKLGLFQIVDENNKFLKIDSRYFGRCSLTD